MEKDKKSGMQKGFLVYEKYKEVFLNSISDYSTTKDVMISINEKMPFDVKLSWNTVHKYLDLLSQEGKVEHKILGEGSRKIHIWKKI